jgi:predicted anti-sigma-YlaC factor YlaD
MTDHVELRRSLGSYLMGALDPLERAEVEEHLGSCGSCREELASYAGLPGLMSRLTRQEVVSEALLPPLSLLPSVLAAVEQQRVAEARRLRRWRTGAGAALGAAAVAAIALVGVPGGGPSRVAFTAAAGQVASGDLAVADKPWGTALHLRVRVPDAPSYIAWAVDASGHRTVAASWGRTPGGFMDVDGATALHGRSLTYVVVTTGAGVALLTVQRT